MDQERTCNNHSPVTTTERPLEDVDVFPSKDNTYSHEASSSESVSSGKLKHELHLLRSQLINKVALLESDKVLSQTREADLKDQVQVLSRRLMLATTRCEAALQVAAQTAEVQAELQRATEGHKRLSQENAGLTKQLNAVKDLLDALPTDRLVFMTRSSEGTFEIDVEAYSRLKGFEAEKLSSSESEKLSLCLYAKHQLHRLVSLFAQEILSLRRQVTAAAETILFEGTTPRWHSNPIGKSQGERGQAHLIIETAPVNSMSNPRVRLLTDPNLECQNESTPELKAGYSGQIQGEKKEVLTVVGQDCELAVARRRINCLQADKTHLMNQITSLTEQLTKAEQRLAETKCSETPRWITDFESARNQRHSEQFLEQRFMEQAKAMRAMSEKECRMLSEIHTKELQLMREQRDTAMAELDRMRSSLREAEREAAQYKTQVESLNTRIVEQMTTGGQQSREGMHALSARMTCALVELDTIRLARQDALLQVEKLNAQLDASKKAYYELEAKTTQERLTLSAKLRAVEEKLQLYETLETKLDEAVELTATDRESFNRSDHAGHQTLLNHIDQYCMLAKTKGVGVDTYILPTMACRRLEHSLKLAKRITELQLQCQRLTEENSTKTQELEVTRKEADRLGNMVTLMDQPADCLASVLADREQQLAMVRAQLAEQQKRVRLKTEECQRLNQERNAMAVDLERLLTRRQSLAQLRKQMLQLSQTIREQQELSKDSHPPRNSANTDFKRIVYHKTAPQAGEHISSAFTSKPLYTIDRS